MLAFWGEPWGVWHLSPIFQLLSVRPLHQDFSLLFCEKWSGFFNVHRVWLSYTWDPQLNVSYERLGNEDKAPCKRGYCHGGIRTHAGTSRMEVHGLHWHLDRSATTAPPWYEKWEVGPNLLGNYNSISYFNHLKTHSVAYKTSMLDKEVFLNASAYLL